MPCLAIARGVALLFLPTGRRGNKILRFALSFGRLPCLRKLLRTPGSAGCRNVELTVPRVENDNHNNNTSTSKSKATPPIPTPALPAAAATSTPTPAPTTNDSNKQQLRQLFDCCRVSGCLLESSGRAQDVSTCPCVGNSTEFHS